MAGRIKIYELAKELGHDARNVVEVAQRLGIDIKNPTNFIGSEEARLVREHYRKSTAAPRRVAGAPAAAPKSAMTESRVGSTVIRRRAKSVPDAPKHEEPDPEPIAMEPEPEEIAAAESVEVMAEEPIEVAVEEPMPEVIAEAEAQEEISADEEPIQEMEASPAAETEQPETEESGVGQVRTGRRVFPSIIKKIATEEYLGEKIGPKPPKREVRPTPPPAARKPGAPGVRTAATGTQTQTTGEAGTGPKRVREITVGAAAVPERDATRRKLMERQSAVFRSSDFLKRELVRTGQKKKKSAMNRPAMKTMITTRAEHKRVVSMAETIIPSELAKEMGVKVNQVLDKMRGLGAAVSDAGTIDFDTATLVATEFGYSVKQEVFREEDFLPTVEAEGKDMRPRAPVVTIMGHVDHGKTSILDKIRSANVVEGEAGGITQHVGAYTVKLKKGNITFIDTPGHEAFTAMRARGAKVTDIVILVVSAVEGPMPQTLESLAHAKAAGVPVIVAINKTDLPEANPDRVKQTLAGHELTPEEWGGDTIYAPVSAKTGKGIDELLESILLQAELQELKADYGAPARGTIIESSLDKGRGPVATVLVQQGILKSGDVVACGAVYGKIRAITDFQGKRASEAGPSEAVEILGLSEVPVVGETLNYVGDEKTARELTGARQIKIDGLVSGEARPKMTLEEMLAGAGGGKEVRLVLKADVLGSVEAIKEALNKFPQDRVKLRVLHSAVGGVTESDIMLASASGGVVVGFNVRPDSNAKKAGEREHVDIRSYRIIYELLDEVKKLMEGQLDKKVTEKTIGRAEVRDVFQIPKVGAVAGSAVTEGKVVRGCYLRLLRDSRVIYDGKVATLRRFKDDVREVTNGHECGISLENFNDIKAGDQLEAYEKIEIAGSL